LYVTAYIAALKLNQRKPSNPILPYSSLILGRAKQIYHPLPTKWNAVIEEEIQVRHYQLDGQETTTEIFEAEILYNRIQTREWSDFETQGLQIAKHQLAKRVKGILEALKPISLSS
jgi:hypothetical protein